MMGTRKRSSLLLAFAISLTLLGASPSVADDQPRQKNSKIIKSERASFGPRCEPTTAVSHAPKDVEIPDRVMTRSQLARAMRQIVLETNCGEIVIQPNYRARHALTAIHTLVRVGYYDQSLCHRLVTNQSFVLHCGDPTATGSGFPNFTFNELENTPRSEERNYPEGTVAMANIVDSSGDRLMGSQFFMFYEDSTMDPNYTIFGRVIKGLDVLKMIARAGVRDGLVEGTPRQTVAIERAYLR